MQQNCEEMPAVLSSKMQLDGVGVRMHPHHQSLAEWDLVGFNLLLCGRRRCSPFFCLPLA